MAGVEPDTKPLTAGEILREIRIKLGLSHKDVARQIPHSSSAIGHWETGRTVPKREYLVDVIQLCIRRETSKLNRNPSYKRFVTRKKANQLLKAFKYSDIELDDIGVEAWIEWIVAEDKISEYDSLMQIGIEGLQGKNPAAKAKLIREIRRILRKLDE